MYYNNHIMKIYFICVGKLKENYFTLAVDEYRKRLSRFCDLTVIEVEEASKETNLLKKNEIEGKRILEKCRGTIISLDRCGEMLSSEEFAETLSERFSHGVSEISFVIGGSNGLSDEVKNQSYKLISFGKITFPHQLFRVVLSEQVYRAFTIINGLPYHK